MRRLILISFLLILLSGCSAIKPNEIKTGFILNDSALYNQPSGQPIRSDLFKGRVVTVLDQKGSWTKIVIYTYDTPMDNMGWIKSKDLTYSPDNLILIEGRIKTEQYVYNDGPSPRGKVSQDKVGPHNPILITERKNGWVHGSFGGGLDGWVQETNIEFTGPTIN